MDRLEYDVKRALITSPNRELQWHEIRDELFKKYEDEYEDKASFTTILHRKLQKMPNLQRKSLGHQKVFYFVSKDDLKKVSQQVDRETAHRRFDEIWDSFTPEQRKRELQSLLRQRLEPLMILQNLQLEMLPFLTELQKDAQEWIEKLETPSEEITKKYSEEERLQFLKQLRSNFEELKRLADRIARDAQRQISDEDFQSRINLFKEFMNRVVDANYYGDMQEAFLDLMRKAVEEARKSQGGRQS